MTVRVRYHNEISVSSTSSEEKDLANLKYEVFTDGLGEGGIFKVTVPKTTTDMEVRMGNVDEVNFLQIRTTSKDTTLDPVTLKVKFNDTGNDEIPITPLTSTKEGVMMISTSELEALFVTNEDTAVDMEITVIFAGD